MPGGAKGARPEKGELVVQIDSLAAGGDGVARAPDGRVVFVPFAAPGDRVRVRIEKARRRFLRARIVALLEPSPERVEPRCRFFGRCGGCTWQHLDYPTQVEAKRAIVADALARIGGFREIRDVPLTPSPRAYGYRMRARLRVEEGRVGYRQRASHEICPVDSCPVLLPALEEGLRALAAAPPRGAGSTGEWELACAGGQLRSVALGRRTAAGAERLLLEVAGDKLRFSPGVFAQANAPLLETLVRRTAEAVGGGGLLVELHAGSGLFTLALARRFDRVVAVESSGAAVHDLRANLAAAGLGGVEVLRRRVEDLALGRGGRAPDAVLLDPPRTGLPDGGVDVVAGLAARRIVYLSCDPATLARDLRGLCGQGYRLARVEAFDLFPQTPHVEALAVLEPLS